MKKSPLFLLAAIALFGAGCSSSAPTDQPAASTDQYQTEPPSSAMPQEEMTSSSEPAMMMDDSTSTTPSATTAPTTTSMMNDTLAFPGVLPESETNKKVLIKTTLGNIEIQIDPKAGPNAASNFVYLVKHKFYDGLIFHRVISGFMIQGGDPTGTGTSGPGYKFADDPVTGQYLKGTVAMANAGPNTNGSQFFIMVDSVGLPPSYSIFGHVISGQDVADKISEVQRDSNDRPYTDVKMLSVTIE